MDQSVYITKSFRENRNTILRTAIFCCAILAMNVGNLFRGTYTSQLTTKTLPNMRSDLYSLALNSVPIVTTGWEEYNSVNHAQMFRSFLTDEIEKRLIVAVNNSNIYKILQNIKDRTNFLLSSWYDFALNVSNKYPIKTHSGYKSSPDMCVLIDEEIACDSLIKLLNINNAYFPISIRSSGIYTARYVYIASSTLAGRILSPGFNGLRESGILERWSQRNADRALLNPGTFYTNKTYFGTDLHRALIHWPPRKSPEFENDVVRLENFSMFGCILIFLYFSSGIFALREVFCHRETRETKKYITCLSRSFRQPTDTKWDKIHVVPSTLHLAVESM